jgi:hypothetical protein
MARIFLAVAPAVVAMYLPFCAAEVRPAVIPSAAPAPSLWQEPTDLVGRELFYGPWGPERAPDPRGRYTLVERKHSGVNPGMTVRDDRGREWSVKQAPPHGQPPEGPIELVLSRVLSALGYHQPPVYYLPAFTLADDWGVRIEPGGRFRLKDQALKDRGSWSWQQNPFVGTQPYQGLLVILLAFGSTDLKNSNNTLYEYRAGDRTDYWYVVRDLGSALGSTGRFAPRRGDPDAFERHGFIKGGHSGFVAFDYRGWHQELVRDRIRPADVVWAGNLLARLDDRQWQEAFRAGGYRDDVAGRFIQTLRRRIAEALRVEPTLAITAHKGD